jgi:2,4-dienoyl-CoA reductase (NADPH2)
VTLWEKDLELGGMLLTAGGADPLLERYLRWLTRQVEQAGIALEVGRPATVVAVQAEAADEVILATGAAWGVAAEVPGADLAHVMSVPALSAWLCGDDSSLVGPRVVLIGGGKASITIADLAVRRGRQVIVVSPTNVFGEELGLPGRWRLVPDIERAGAQLIADATVEAITPEAVRLRTGDSTLDMPADTVIFTAAVTPDTRLAAELRGAGMRFHLVGDCNSVRHIEGANLDAASVALALCGDSRAPTPIEA